MIKKGLIHVIYIKYALYRGFISAFFCLSVCQSVGQLVHPLVFWLVLLAVLPPDGCIVVCLSDLFKHTPLFSLKEIATNTASTIPENH